MIVATHDITSAQIWNTYFRDFGGKPLGLCLTARTARGGCQNIYETVLAALMNSIHTGTASHGRSAAAGAIT